MTDWRAAGLNYIMYSMVAASYMRLCLKPEARIAALKRAESIVVIRKWVDGKPAEKLKFFELKSS